VEVQPDHLALTKETEVLDGLEAVAKCVEKRKSLALTKPCVKLEEDAFVFFVFWLD
jgi:hypothetical protein